MKTLRLSCLSLLMVLALSANAFAGDILTPGATGQQGSPGVTGEILTPGVTGDILTPGVIWLLGSIL